ncbi:TadE/TadG family type IV pilus assembly protein [Streptomyces zaomyceticus]|uniref:TadE/TadG family type IV pilus assembly protein n=1 Tax=Streptomyces zaomyceticus TaxID=68286 RepID=UPI00344AFE21
MPHTHGHRAPAGSPHRERGQAAIEYLGFLPILMLVAAAGVQIGLVAYTAQQATTAARAGARAASLHHDAQQACARAVSGWLADRTTCESSRDGDTAAVTVTIRIPSIIPLWDPIGDVRQTATMPLDHWSSARRSTTP